MDKNSLLEKVEIFKQNWQENPIVSDENGIIVLNLYRIQRVENPIFQGWERNTRETAEPRNDYFEKIILNEQDLNIIEKYISFENFSIKKELKIFSELQNIQKKYLSFSSIIPLWYDINETTVIDTNKYENYLDHLKMIQNIKTKTSKIVKDKFNVGDTEDIDTSAIFANVWYIVKGFEWRYLSLSKGDRTFIKNFMDDQIREGVYKLTIKEAFPFYTESIKEIIKIWKELLKLTENKNRIKATSKKLLGDERKSLEACWQLYFDRYLRIFLMNYKEFYSQIVFKKIDGYDKDTRPDFLAVDIYNNIDIIEIKTHRTILFKKESNRDSYYPSHDLNKSIFQLNKYLDLKSNNIDLSKIVNDYTKSLIGNDKIYRPRWLLIISSKDHITSDNTSDELWARLEKEIKKLKTTYNNIDIVLFDELIQNLENYVSYLDISLDTNGSE